MSCGAAMDSFPAAAEKPCAASNVSLSPFSPARQTFAHPRAHLSPRLSPRFSRSSTAALPRSGVVKVCAASKYRRAHSCGASAVFVFLSPAAKTANRKALAAALCKSAVGDSDAGKNGSAEKGKISAAQQKKKREPSTFRAATFSPVSFRGAKRNAAPPPGAGEKSFSKSAAALLSTPRTCGAMKRRAASAAATVKSRHLHYLHNNNNNNSNKNDKNNNDNRAVISYKKGPCRGGKSDCALFLSSVASPASVRPRSAFRVASAPLLPRSTSAAVFCAEHTLSAPAPAKTQQQQQQERLPAAAACASFFALSSFAQRPRTPPVRRPTTITTTTTTERAARSANVLHLHKSTHSGASSAAANRSTPRDGTPANKRNECQKAKRARTPKSCVSRGGSTPTPVFGLFGSHRAHLTSPVPSPLTADLRRVKTQRYPPDITKPQTQLQQHAKQQMCADKDKHMQQRSTPQQKGATVSRPFVRPTNSTICREAALRQCQRAQNRQIIEKHATDAEHLPRALKEVVRRKLHRDVQPARAPCAVVPEEKGESKTCNLESPTTKPEISLQTQETNPPLLRASSFSSSILCKEKLPVTPLLQEQLQTEHRMDSADACASSDCGLSFRRFQCFVQSEKQVKYIRPTSFDSPYRGVRKHSVNNAAHMRSVDCHSGFARRKASARDFVSQQKHCMRRHFHLEETDNECEDKRGYGDLDPEAEEDEWWAPTGMRVRDEKENSGHAISFVECGDESEYDYAMRAERRTAACRDNAGACSFSRSPSISPPLMTTPFSFIASKTTSPNMCENIFLDEVHAQKQLNALFPHAAPKGSSSDKSAVSLNAKDKSLSLSFCRSENVQRLPRAETPEQPPPPPNELPSEIVLKSQRSRRLAVLPYEVIVPRNTALHRSAEERNRTNALKKRQRLSLSGHAKNAKGRDEGTRIANDAQESKNARRLTPNDASGAKSLSKQRRVANNGADKRNGLRGVVH